MPAAYLKAPELWMVQTSCWKIRFATRRQAEAAKQGTNRNKGFGLTQHGTGHLTTYHCKCCAGWHLGHTGGH